MMPPVSTMRRSCPRQLVSPYRRSRVMPGSSPTMARREPTSRLNNVDLPTLGRPTTAIVGRPTVMSVIDLRLMRVIRYVFFLGTRYQVLRTVYYRDSVASTSQPASPRSNRDGSLYQF